MNNKYNYPSEYELKELFTSFLERSFLNKFAQSRGIFITNSNQEEISKELSTLLYDENDLEELRNEAYQISANHTLNGFVVTSEDMTFSLAKLYENIRTGFDFKIDMKLSQLTLEATKSSDSQSLYKGSIQYTKRKPGRIEFLQYEESTFDFYMQEIGASKGEIVWQVEVDCNKSVDSKELRNLFERKLNKGTDIETIDQDNISSANTIKFFDELANTGMDADWKCRDIKHIAVRKGKDEDGDSENRIDEEEILEVDDQDEIVEIKHAILQGQNLRDNFFVKEFEKSGYKFTAMTYEFHHIREPYIMQIKAEFKGRPKVFEVSIKSYEENSGLSAARKASSLTNNKNREIRSLFWNNAKKIYNGL